MNLKQYAIEKAISLAEAKLETGLTHWAQNVALEAETEPIETESQEPVEAPEAPEAPVETESKEAVAEVRALQTCIGFKSIPYLKAVKAGAAHLPEEYKLVKHLIKRYL